MIGRAKSVEPLVDEEEYEVPCWLYVFNDGEDLDEFYFCDYCGGWISKYVYEHNLCEC